MIDALLKPIPESRATVVHSRTQEHLAALGVQSALSQRARMVEALEVFDGRRSEPRVRIGVEHVDSAFPHPLDLPQSETEAVLRARGLVGLPSRRWGGR